MWFKLAGADFSKNNLGTMSSISSSYLIDYTGLTGMSGSPSSVSYAGSDAGTSKTASVVVTVTSGYTFKQGSKITASGGKSGTVFTADKDYTGGQTFTFSMAITANTKLSGTAEATGGSSSGGGSGDGGGSGTVTPIIATGVDVAGKMPQVDGYKDSTSGHIMEYSGYDWSQYDIYVSCRYGTTSAMFAACVWGDNDTYLGGIWQSTGTAEIFTEKLLTEADLPNGVTWGQVKKIGLSWSSGKNTPQMKLVPKS